MKVYHYTLYDGKKAIDCTELDEPDEEMAKEIMNATGYHTLVLDVKEVEE